MKLRLFAAATIFLIFCFPVFSQETSDITADTSSDAENGAQLKQAAQLTASGTETEGSEDNTIYVINSFDFNIDGRTRPYAVIHRVELKEGEEIKGLENLEKYILDKTQLLINERVIKKASIDYSIGQAGEDGKYPVDLVINIFDSFNIIALPYPKYSLNSGYSYFDLTLKARDYNFFGTMNPLRIDLGYSYDGELEKTTFLFEVDSNTTFKAYGYMWNFRFVNTFKYRPDDDEPYFFNNITGLSMELPFRTTTFTFGFEESVVYNEEFSDIYKAIYRKDSYVPIFQSGLYMASRPYISWRIPTGFKVGEFGDLYYNPYLGATFYHEVINEGQQQIKKGPVLSASHYLGFGRVDWIGNFRKGLNVYIYNSYSYDFYRSNIDVDTPPGWRKITNEPLSADVSFSATAHAIVTSFIGFSSRLMYRHWFLYEYGGSTSPGDALRGIDDDHLWVNHDLPLKYMLSLNMDFPVKIITFTPSKWFEYKIMRLFDFEFHLSPFMDMALFYGPLPGRFFNTRDFLVSGGMEAIIYPGLFRSLYLRVSAGCDLQKYLDQKSMIPRSNNREIFIGIGHHY